MLCAGYVQELRRCASATAFPFECLHRHANQCMACTCIHIGSHTLQGKTTDIDGIYTVWKNAKHNERSLLEEGMDVR